MTGTYALGSFSENGGPIWPGVARAGMVAPLAEISGAPDRLEDVFREWDRWSDEIDAGLATLDAAAWRPERDLRAHLPFKPENLFGAGANYRKHVIDLIMDTKGGPPNLSDGERLAFATKLMDDRAATGKPFVWVGLRSAIAGPDTPLLIPYDFTQTDWELELGVVIGKAARRVSRKDALDHVAGYMIANDITARELVNRPDVPQMGMDWLACKSAPGFHVLGPLITPAKFVPDPQNLHISLQLNGKQMQDEGTSDMIFDVARLIEFISSYTTIHPGDVIMSGSPSGNGTHYNRFIEDGDIITGEIKGLIGTQVIHCRAEPRGA